MEYTLPPGLNEGYRPDHFSQQRKRVGTAEEWAHRCDQEDVTKITTVYRGKTYTTRAQPKRMKLGQNEELDGRRIQSLQDKAERISHLPRDEIALYEVGITQEEQRYEIRKRVRRHDSPVNDEREPMTPVTIHKWTAQWPRRRSYSGKCTSVWDINENWERKRIDIRQALEQQPTQTNDEFSEIGMRLLEHHESIQQKLETALEKGRVITFQGIRTYERIETYKELQQWTEP
jgi:hypothetical protein